jgi:hypothetical protein
MASALEASSQTTPMTQTGSSSSILTPPASAAPRCDTGEPPPDNDQQALQDMKNFFKKHGLHGLFLPKLKRKASNQETETTETNTNTRENQARALAMCNEFAADSKVYFTSPGAKKPTLIFPLAFVESSEAQRRTSWSFSLIHQFWRGKCQLKNKETYLALRRNIGEALKKQPRAARVVNIEIVKRLCNSYHGPTGDAAYVHAISSCFSCAIYRF